MATFLHKHSLLHLVPLWKTGESTWQPSSINTAYFILFLWGRLSYQAQQTCCWRSSSSSPPTLRGSPNGNFRHKRNTACLILFLHGRVCIDYWSWNRGQRQPSPEHKTQLTWSCSFAQQGDCVAILWENPNATFPYTHNATYLILFLCGRLLPILCNPSPYTQLTSSCSSVEDCYQSCATLPHTHNWLHLVSLWKTVTNIVQPFPIHTTDFILFLCGRLLPILCNPSPYTQLISSCSSVEDCSQYCATLPQTHTTIYFILFLCGRLLAILCNPSCSSVEDCHKSCERIQMATFQHKHNTTYLILFLCGRLCVRIISIIHHCCCQLVVLLL